MTSNVEERPTRRSFLDWLLGTTLGALAISIFYPVVRYVTPPGMAESPTSQVLAGKISELPPSSGKVFRFGSRPAIVVRTASGDIRAFSAVCTHLACTVQYRKDLQHIWCACHNGHYDLNGVNIAGPPPRPLERYQVATRGDDIFVSREPA